MRALRPSPSALVNSGTVAHLAHRALIEEATLFPKPGLVSSVDSGSHTDMDYQTLVKSADSLRDYFSTIYQHGFDRSSFHELQKAGLAAEDRMLTCTGGVNTHRGAIFNLGLLCAAAGFLDSESESLTPDAICSTVHSKWSMEILHLKPDVQHGISHGVSVLRKFGLTGGARSEAANGFPSVITGSLPIFQGTLANTGSRELASIQALFHLISHLTDTNLLWRGGLEGMHAAQSAASAFLESGGVLETGWHKRALSIHEDFVKAGLSPGGSADLLAVTLFLYDLASDL